MKQKSYSEPQIVKILEEGKTAVSVKELCRKYGLHETTYYRWKAKYGGLDVSAVKQLKALQDENRQLKKLVAEQALENQLLKELNSKKW